MSIINKFFYKEAVTYSGTNNVPMYDKSQYYLGKVSQVFFNGGVIQNENMTLLKIRLNYQDDLVPNVAGYFILIDGSSGLYLGQIMNLSLKDNDSIHKAMIDENNNVLHPNLGFQLIGIWKNEHFEFPGENTIGLGDKAYVANKIIIKKYLTSLQLSISEVDDDLEFARLNLVQEKNLKFKISADNLLNHHLMIVGATNSGKSTSALAILDKLNERDGKFLIIDPTGEYRHSFINEKNINVKIIGQDLFLNSSQLTDDQWIDLFHPNENTQQVELLEAIRKLKFRSYLNKNPDYIKIQSLKVAGQPLIEKANYLDCENATDEEYKKLQSEWEKEEFNNRYFDIKNLYMQIEKDSLKLMYDKNCRNNIYKKDVFTYGTNRWLIEKIKYYIKQYHLDIIFKDNVNDLNTTLDAFMKNNTSLYLGLPDQNFSSILGKVLVDYICSYLLKNNNSNSPMTLFIDEVHRYAKESNDMGMYDSPLIDIAREGRKRGIFLFLTTQSPKDVPSILLNQIGTLLIHRLTGQNEIASISNFLNSNLLSKISLLNQGQAILTSVNLLQPVELQIMKSSRKQENETPHVIGLFKR